MKLNLVEIGWPVCFMKFKSVLDGLDMREVLEVLTTDPDVAEGIVLIADNSDYQTIRQDKRGSLYRVYIQKKP